ncbi:MAG: flagellar filament capping protein FliD [Desulfovibrio sp.]|nr:flagellar filament capping protein FliD [Desulfovibrio sp.]
MSISISGSTAISGLSGMDTDFDSTLEKLYAVEKTQLNQLKAWKGDWQLRYDAFNTVIDQMSAAKQMLSAIGNPNSFVTKNSLSTDEKVLTALATGSAADAQHKIVVSQMANNAIWCNTGAVFENKADIINKTGQTVTFSFDYAGKHYSYDIAPNTTLESFVSMINNSSKNPGINLSVINTGNGYVYQIAGKSTGESNSLTIYSCALEGMDVTQSTSVWSTNSSYDMTVPVTDPTKYTYTATLESGTKISVSLKGDATDQELAQALTNAAGAGLVTTSFDASGNLVIGGITSLSRSYEGKPSYTPAGLTVSAGSDLSEQLLSSSPSETLDFTVTLADGNTRSFSLDSSASKQDFLNQLKQSLQSSAQVKQNAGTYQVKLSEIAGLTVAGHDLSDLGLAQESYAATGTADAMSAALTDATTKVTFSSGKLASRIDGADSGSGEALRYTIVSSDGSAIYVDETADGNPLTSDLTNNDLLAAIKAAMTAQGKSFEESTDSDGNTVLALENVKAFYLSTGAKGTSGFSTKMSDVTMQMDGSSFYSTTDGEGNPVRYLEEPPQLSYSMVLNDGSTIAFSMASGSTMEEIAAELANQLAGTGSEVSLLDSEGNAWVDAATSGEAYLHVSNLQSLTGSGLAGQIVSSSNWSITNSSNAIYQVDNWPMAMQSESNTITDLLDGVSLTLHGVGESNLTISTDVASVETSIQNFLDAVNSVIMTINELSKVDEDKETTSNDPKDKGSSNYSKSTLTAEKGGLLTGNYGVQLVKSRFLQVVTGTPPGFQSMATADDLLSGDMLSCLANLGVKTDTDATSQTYGLLVIAPRSDYLQTMDEENYENMLNNHISDLVDFFVSEGTGTSTTADFRYNSHVSGITEAGIYDVSYDVDATGHIANVTIGGEACVRDESRGGYYYTCAAGAARGLAINIDDMTEGTHTGQVRIKQGLVQTVESFLSKELVFNKVNVSSNAPDDIIEAQLSLKSENGAMMTLKANYAGIMENIDKSIAKEQQRLDSWYNRQKKVFSNLETLLRKLNDEQTSLEAQIKQLGNSK